MILKSHILKLNRIQTSQNRDLKNGALLDRNERVDYFNSSTFKKITKSISRYSLNATPEVQNLYKILGILQYLTVARQLKLNLKS